MFASFMLALMATAAPMEPYLDDWGRGPSLGAYTHIGGGCETLVHTFGRNGAWGRWTVPLGSTRFSVRPEEEGGPPRIFVECLTQAGCIGRKNSLEEEATHFIQFGDQAQSEAMVARIEAHKAACAAEV